MTRDIRLYLTLLSLAIFAATGRTASAAQSCQDCPQILGVTLPLPCWNIYPPGSGWTNCTIILTGRADWSCQVGESRCDMVGPPDPNYGGLGWGRGLPCYSASDPIWGITAENQISPFDPVDCLI